jgi:hypothetical protein
MGSLWISIPLSFLAALAAVLAVRGWRFRAFVARQARTLWEQAPAPAEASCPLEELPPPVRRYLELAVGMERPAPMASIRLRHGGTFRPDARLGWLPIRGEQYFATDPPGFLWWGRVRLLPGLWIDACDRSVAAVGNMHVWLASLVTLADASGPGIDQGALLRLLAEMAWFPTALRDRRYVTWKPVAEDRAEATLRGPGRQASAVFHFGADGFPYKVTAERYRDVGGQQILTAWSGELRDFRPEDGLLVPHELEAVWQLEDEPFPYARFRVERFEVDRPEPW